MNERMRECLEEAVQAGGWECPRCHVIYSLYFPSCRCPPTTYTTGGGTAAEEEPGETPDPQEPAS